MLTIYAPFSNKNSKAWEVFNGVEKSWPDQITKLDNTVETDPVSNSMFWGFVGNNREMVKKLEARNHNYWFTDTPYFGRFDNSNLKPDNHYWRVCKNAIHVPYLKDCKADRFEKFGIKIKAPNFAGKYILVCPSVTSCSIAAVEAMCEGIPVFCDHKSFAVDVGNVELSDIENPYYGGPEPWLYSLAYQQFTPEEIENGTAVEILMDKGIL